MLGEKIVCSTIEIIRRMNQWWDKDEDREVASIVSGILILAGILTLKKPILFLVALILIINRVLHRFNIWTNMECKVDKETPVESPIVFNREPEIKDEDKTES